MNNAKMKSELDRANALLAEKLGKPPYLWLDLTLNDNGSWRVGGAYLYGDMRDRFDGGSHNTPEGAFKLVFEKLAAMPDPDTIKVRKFQKNLAKVIDEGNSLAMPADVMDPLSAGMSALSDNLLTDQRDASQ